MRAIIGPNGAGKTTMMDVITGKTRPDVGDVLFDGRVDLTQLDEASIAELGIGRKFQKPTVFESQTVEDNILLALKGPRIGAVVPVRLAQPGAPAELDDVLETTGLIDHRKRHGGGPFAWPEAVAGDRHAAGAGSKAPAGRRAGRGHDRRRDRGRPRGC